MGNRIAVLLALVLLLGCAPVFAQSRTATWNAPAEVSTLAAANALSWNLTYTPPGGSAMTLQITGAVCSGSVAPFSCSGVLPPPVPTTYDTRYTLTAKTPTGAESAPSLPYVIPPSPPTLLHVTP